MKLAAFLSFLGLCFVGGFLTLTAATSVPNTPGMTVNGAVVPPGVPNVVVTSSSSVAKPTGIQVSTSAVTNASIVNGKKK